MSEDYIKGWKDVCSIALDKMDKIWIQYIKDPYNVPKPDFISAVALMTVLEDEYERGNS